MKTLIKKIKENLWMIVVILALGILVGYFAGRSTHRDLDSTAHRHMDEATAGGPEQSAKQQIWTCSMHPQIRMDHPGQCPICGMDLIPLDELSAADTAVSPDEIQMTDAAMKIADIRTIVVQKSYPDKEIYLLGKVKPDERSIAELTARFGGRIEKLFVNFTGQQVRKGEKLALIYSPALVTAQKELLEAVSYKQTSPDLYRAARNKLKLWDLTDGQINDIERKGETQNYFDVLSPISGTVTRRDVAAGDYVKEGSPLFQVINLDKVWVMFEAYESDLPWIRQGDMVQFTVRSLPGQDFHGKISFIDPVMDPRTRIANVRVEVQNSDEHLKPEMFADGIVTSSIAGNKKDLMIPKTAVLWTGKRAVVYVKDPKHLEPTFQYREITLGPEAGEFYVVAAGLEEGEEITVNGVFKIDAAAQLAGKPSMMNPTGGATSAGSMPGMDMGNNAQKKMSTPEEMTVPEAFKKQLTTVFDAYIPLKNNFVASDPEKVKSSAASLGKKLSGVDMELLSGSMHSNWMEDLQNMKKALGIIEGTDDLEQQREGFSAFSNALYNALKQFGIEGDTAYYQYCPMAFGNKGAFWLSEIKEIENPYFGDAMLKCGETRETLK